MVGSENLDGTIWQNDWPQAMVKALAGGYDVISVEFLTKGIALARIRKWDGDTRGGLEPTPKYQIGRKENTWRNSGW
jgi:hypothetical protein